MGDFAETINNLNLVDAVNRRREAAVHTEDLVVDDDAKGEEVEEVGEVMPHICSAVLALAFSVEAVGLGHATRFVVAADQGYAARVAKLEADEEGDGLDTEESAVDIVAC